MNTYLLLWNPTNPDTWPDFERNRKTTLAGRPVRGGWSTGNNKSMPKGSRIFMVRQYKDRGIIAAGQTIGEVFQNEHWEDPSRDANYVRARWDVILSPDQVLPTDILKEQIPAIFWNYLQASGTHVPNAAAEDLTALWKRHLARLGISSASKTKTDRQIAPDEVDGKVTAYPEGAVTRILVNAYERNEQARTTCLEHFGATCAVCEFDFHVIYGDLGAGFIHVHHLKNLASIGKSYNVDPIGDLRPVCPNCHSMLHRRNPPLTIEELKRVISRTRRLNRKKSLADTSG